MTDVRSPAEAVPCKIGSLVTVFRNAGIIATDGPSSSGMRTSGDAVIENVGTLRASNGSRIDIALTDLQSDAIIEVLSDESDS